jgi:CheY-like chemotaxis protein
VRDTGVGIPPDRLDTLFKPFSQVDASTTRRFGGTGLGLSIVRSIALVMGGGTGVSSTEGVGSIFWATILLRPAAAVLHARTQPVATLSVNAAHQSVLTSIRRILVVEDNEVNQKVAQRTIEKLGFRVNVANNGLEAVRAWETGDYDLILMDCQMPEMDGYEATREIRSRETGDQHIPIIALTAHAMAGAETECRQAGMDDYLSKPLRRADLSQKLEHWLPDSAQPVLTVQADKSA